MKTNSVKRYKFVLIISGIATALLFIHPEVAKMAWNNSLHFLLEVASILPPVLLLLGLLEAWLPSNTIETYLGQKSGFKGILTAILLGSFAAGPLFTAFPIAASLSKKGGRTANTVIFLGAWATIKFPMIVMESRFLGLRFSLLRLAATIPFIILIGLLIEKLSPHDQIRD